MVKRYFFVMILVGSVAIPPQGIAEENSSESANGEEKAASDAKPEKSGDSKAPEKSTASQAESQPTQTESQPAPPSAKEKAAAGTYTVKLRDLEDRINRLKEQIFRTKARLSLLAESVLDRKIAGAKAVINFKNEMGGSFKLVKATFLLDGGPIFNKTDDNGSLAERDEINLFDGPVMPGEHTLSVVLHYRGHGYGIFSYLRGYSFKTRSSRTFSLNEGKVLKMKVIGFEKGGATTPLEERPDVRYTMDIVDYEEEQAQKEEDEEEEE